MPALITHNGPASSASPAPTVDKKKNSRRLHIQASLLYSPQVPLDVIAVDSDSWNRLFSEIPPSAEHSSGTSQIRYVSVRSSIPSSLQAFRLLRTACDSNLSPHTCVISTKSRSGLTSQVTLCNITPVVLTHVLVSCSPGSYELSKGVDGLDNIKSKLLANDSHLIFRQGDYLPEFDCLVRICEPVDQGLFVSQSTKVTIVREESRLQHSNGKTLEPNHSNDVYQLDSLNGQGKSSVPASPPDMELEISKFLAFDKGLDELELPVSKSLNFDVKLLDHQIPSNSLTPFPNSSDDSEARGYVKTEQLAAIGCFSGDLVSMMYSVTDSLY